MQRPNEEPVRHPGAKVEPKPDLEKLKRMYAATRDCAHSGHFTWAGLAALQRYHYYAELIKKHYPEVDLKTIPSNPPKPKKKSALWIFVKKAAAFGVGCAPWALWILFPTLVGWGLEAAGVGMSDAPEGFGPSPYVVIGSLATLPWMLVSATVWAITRALWREAKREASA